ncbi:hypothetical protein [Fictibacillus norfolkensis]|uniref:Uncharacterized protein n=1 Tax=Fictibacillus norfolkensis TaxID=2762233 RepID=A0ABR8SPH1_9BACL|nr:hypothetical protein [Fictibacillus norfolkensis]MBD7965390.1 hypothetical protein [Fictibacillus norfolkensis]
MKKSAKEYLNLAVGIRNGSTAFLRSEQVEMRNMVSAIRGDKHLTRDGRIAKEKEVKGKKGADFLAKLLNRKQQHDANLIKAIKVAEKALKAKLKKPAQDEIDAFTRNFRNVKMEILLSNRPDQAEKRLKEFISEKVTDSYYAELVSQDFTEIIGSIVSAAGPQAPVFKARLFDQYQSLQNDFASDEVKEAREVKEMAEAYLNGGMFGGFIAEQAANDAFGNEVGFYLNKPEEFFAIEENIEHKPADFVDPELAEEARYQTAYQNINTNWGN